MTDWTPLTILVKSIALDDWLGSVNYFSKKLHLRCLTGLWGTSGLSWNVSLYSTSNLYVNQTFSMSQYKQTILQLPGKHLCAKDDGYRMGQKKQKTFRRQRVISFLNLINLIATTRLPNIHNRNTEFLYKEQFLSKLNKSCIIFSWHGWWRLLCCIWMQ